MRINYNVSSIIARNAMNNNDKRVAASTKKLSSGYKINSAADNASGLAIARRMNAQIKSLQEANQSANDGLSALNTADGAMAEIHDILQRMNELAIQSANGTNADSDREMIQTEIDQLVSEIDRIAKTTEFNAQNLLDGSFAFKAYANVDNVKVMSHTEGVATGTYVIGQLKYYHYEDMTTRYKIEETKEKDSDGKIVNIVYGDPPTEVQKTEKERYEVNNDNDLLSNHLVTSTSVSKYQGTIDRVKGFPEGAKVTVEDENIVIKAQGNFEMKIAVNDRTPIHNASNKPDSTSSQVGVGAQSPADAVSSITTKYIDKATGGTVVTTTSYSSVTNYRNIAVKGPDGKRYNISELNFFKNVDSAGNELTDPKLDIYTDYKGDSGKGLADDFADYFKASDPNCSIKITGVKYNENAATPPESFSVTYVPTDGKTGQVGQPKTIEFALYQDTNELGAVMKDQKELKHYLYTETMTTRTEYTIGNNTPDDCLKIDVTGMGPMVVQVGANAGQFMELEIPSMSTANLGVNKLDLTTEESARLAIDDVSDAIVQLSAIRSRIGAYSNRLEHTITNLDTTEENITASYSRIMDVDMATEMTEYSTVQVLVQASTSMLAQANERPQQVLQLLQ